MDLFEQLLYSEAGEGDVFHTDPVEIPGLEGTRPLTLYLPPDYLLEPDQHYPIAYFFDGQNLYEGQESGPPGWNLHQILDARYADGLEVPIAVGIHHGLNRDEELCPWPAEKGQTPRGDALLDWIIHDLHPQLVEQLRIEDTPENRLIGGASLGGLLALYAGFRNSDFFGKIMSMSPSLWVGNGAIYDYIAEAAFLYNLDFMRLYIDCGAFEDDDDDSAWSESFWEADSEDTFEESFEDTSEDLPDDDFDAASDEVSDQSPEASDTEAQEVSSEATESLLLDSQNTQEDPLAELDQAAAELTQTETEPGEQEPDDDEEEWDTDPLEDAEYLIEILEAKGFEEGAHFLWVPDPEGEHNEWHWSKRLPLALAWLFEDP
ncbi:hypothetical protein COW36_12795 [bacterium (Candidatus Blackallbacteria) CG17_big_fil_post_rev_8_21_14_2_50_48_46]|uniref:Esterase n=1 Tax=bacterium (Candidatus Blackallbacteria) CG17_big_fil_post_rev_8_21_14_2_50_48_46 TaxID=2014261 RepID=A0A2M7G458_9BACT|nr:MAG: hypothetical protein COW64_02470 [bacterium (Candidatus Blackallbacteria) CG18_big_fil_WC_8_21_14_2_50_49_26]PIW16639.1 MAG: hypothetical protein COW36_12795 [bacterium (Candidatus Blackallbacteria) CG17_big_fil_post_rev_8_21_14_2_50_48_46]PIW46146.1 MAG: hypothetical protein COW20_18055 [bacterium (Candidatus Blackallbacteria) CG13_big_fil_rev_8_21_14_2_50_49_14]